MSPVRQGIASTGSLNAALQEQLNPASPDKNGLSKKSYQNAVPQILRMGDKVLQRANNYDKDVFNGDTGFVDQVSVAEQLLTVRFAAPGNKGRPCIQPWRCNCKRMTPAHTHHGLMRCKLPTFHGKLIISKFIIPCKVKCSHVHSDDIM